MPKQFAFCSVCRLNHNQGKGHKYGVKHMQKRDQLLGKAHRKIQEVLLFLTNVTRLHEEDKAFNKFWCQFCEEEIAEEGSLFACANTIRHLGSSRHLQRVTSFWTEHGGDFQKQRLYFVTTDDVQKWQAACDAILLRGSGGQDLSSATSSDHGPRSEQTSEWGRLRQEQVSSAQKDVVGDMAADRISNGLASSHSALTFGAVKVRVATVLQEEIGPKTQSLTSIPRLFDHGVGNVHTGASPPWLKASLGVESNGNSSSAVLSRSQERKLAKLRNPKRVGAAWAERRRAELLTEQQTMKSSTAHRDATWFPKFGRVWQSGSRRDTRREFEAEKKLGERRSVSDISSLQPAEVKPYISKRQRLESKTNGTKDASSPRDSAV